MKTFGSILLPFLLAILSCAQTGIPSSLSSKELQADVAILRQGYERLHPGLYRYNSKAQMDAAFGNLSRQLGHDQSLQHAFLAFSEFAAKVRCGHTQANPFNQSKAVVDALFKSSTRLPFYFVWIDRRMIVTRDFTADHLLPAGTDVLEINGTSTEAILSKLMLIARADGSNDDKRMAQLAVTGDSEYESFDLYYPMYFPSFSETYTFKVKMPGSDKPQLISERAQTFEQRIAPIHERESQRQGGDQALFEWRFLPDGTAYVRMPTWALYNSKWNWRQWLDDHLDEAADRRAPALIIDLRGNEGGIDVGDVILAHLVDSPLKISAMQRLVRYRNAPVALVPYLDTWDKSFQDWGSSAVDLSAPWPTAPKEVSYLKLLRDGDDADAVIIKPAGKRFRGKVAVLIDATNSSATFQFAQAVQRQHLGTLIGQPTGGSQRGINGGAFFFLRLPHSGIEMDLPLIGTFPASPMPDRGVTPDIMASPTAADIAAGRDVALETAQRAARR